MPITLKQNFLNSIGASSKSHILSAKMSCLFPVISIKCVLVESFLDFNHYLFVNVSCDSWDFINEIYQWINENCTLVILFS